MGRATATRTMRATRSLTCHACRTRSPVGSTTSLRSGASRRKSSGGSTSGTRSRSAGERASKERLNRLARVLLNRAGAGAGEMRMRNHGTVGHPPFLPLQAAPREPAVLVLVEDVQRLVANLRELRTPPGPAAHGP